MFDALQSRSAAFTAWTILALFPLCLPAKSEAPQQSPVELVREAANNEAASSTGPGLHFMFRDIKKGPHLSQTKLIVETREATAGMLIEQNGQPLSPGERRAEEARLENYVHQPAELTKKRKQEKEDSERTLRILKALPDAFLYEPEGTVNGSAAIGHMDHPLVRLKFRPNPTYQPPTHVEQVLTGMQGELLIDPQEKRIAEINGTLEKEVGFGWGILGHLDRGGRFLVDQADVGENQWEVTRMVLDITGKILFLKRLSLHSSEEFSDFRVVPSDLTFAQGIELLKKEIAKSASAGGEGAKKPVPTSEASATEQRHDGGKAEAQEIPCCNR
jgi:hypothetical protein